MGLETQRKNILEKLIARSGGFDFIRGAEGFGDLTLSLAFTGPCRKNPLAFRRIQQVMSFSRLRLLGLVFLMLGTSYAQCERAHSFDADPAGDQQSATALTPPGAQSGQDAGEPAKAQPKRILGLMPNYRAVSPGEHPPPPTAKQAFKIATQQSFDYSAFILRGR